MKVTMLAKEYPPYIYGGAGVHVRYLSKELSKLIDVEIRCFGDQNQKDTNPSAIGYKSWDLLKCDHEPKFTPALETICINLEMVRDKISSDIVHTHTWYGHFGGLMAKILYKIPFVATCHSLEPLRPWKEDQLGGAYRLSGYLEKSGIEGADCVIAVSNEMKQDIIKYFNVKSENIEVIHNGINLETWKPTPLNSRLKNEYGIKDDYILFVGRPTKQKGMEYLVEAADNIKSGIQVLIAAAGADTKDYEDRMKDQIAKKKNILWINKLLKEEDYVELYTGAKVFVCPSIYEPFGIINLEAMSCETPVVASSVGGIKEVVIPDETGILVEPANPQQIAESVNYLLDHPEVASKMGKNGRKRVEQYFSWAYIASKTKKLYEKIIKR